MERNDTDLTVTMDGHGSNSSGTDSVPAITLVLLPICMTMCCLLGLYGNIVSALIFSHPLMRSPIDVLLAGLSLVDLCLIILAIPVFVFPSINMASPNQFFASLYPTTVLILYPFSLMAQSSSIWTFLVISIERYLAISKPLQRQKLLTTREAKMAQTTVVFVAFLYNLVRFWEYQPEDGFANASVYLRYKPLYFYGYYTSLYQVTHFAVPFFIILLLNLFIVISLSRAPTNLRRFSRSQIQQRKTSVMMVVITTMFAVCNLGPFIINIWEAVNMELFQNPNDEQTLVAFAISDVSNSLVLLNSSTTFLIYLMCCRKYRVLFKYYGRFRRPPGRLMLSEENNVQCALIRAAYPLIKGPHVDLDVRSFSEETCHRSNSTKYSSVPSTNGDRYRVV